MIFIWRQVIPIFLLTQVISCFCYSQNSIEGTIDSLELVLSNEKINEEDKRKTTHLLADYHHSNYDFPAALETYIQAFNLYKSTDQNEIKGRIKMSMGNLYAENSMYSNSTVTYLEAINYLKMANSSFKNGVYMNIGLNYFELNDHEKALEYFELSNKDLVIRDSSDSAFVVLLCSNVANIYLEQGQYELAQDTCQTGLKYAQNLWDPYYLITLYSNLSKSHAFTKDFEKSKEFIITSDSIFQSLLTPDYDSTDRANIVSNLWAEHYIQKQDYDSALHYAEKALQRSWMEKLNFEKLNCYDLLHEIYDSLKDYPNYFKYDSLINQLEDSIYNNNEINNLNEILMDHELQASKLTHHKQLTVLKNEEQIKEYKRYIAGIIILLLLSLILIPVLRVKNKKKLTDLKLEKSVLEKQILEDQKQDKTSELAQFSNYLSNKNEFLVNLKGQLTDLKKDHPDIDIKKITSTINRNLNSDQEQKEFQMYVEQINQDFFFKLQQQFPDLTLKEKRLCSLLVLDLSSKDIASVFSIASSSVEKSRYRLRKKLDLPQGQSLTEYLKSI